MYDLLVILTVVEIALLVLVLAIALILVAARLRTIAAGLVKVAEGITAIKGHLSLIEPVVPTLNRPLQDIVDALPAIAELAETVARG